MEKAEILNILNDWNFWKKEQDTGIIRDELIEKLKKLSESKEIVVVKGIRRSGKSTLLLQFCKKLIDLGLEKKDILIVNFEDPRFKNLNLDLLNKIYELYLTELQPNEKHFVILDEAQNVTGWEKFAKFLHENKRINVFVTGSSSKLLSSEYGTVLAGRHLDIEVRPLSFREYLLFQGIMTKDNLDIANKRHILKKEFKNYLINGGFPKVAISKTETQRKELLETYFRDIIIKDIVKRYKIKEINKIEDLTKYYLTNVSALQSFNNIKNVLKLNLDTVERFSYYLTTVFLLSFVKKFSYSEKEQLLNPRKVYCADNGLRNSVAFTFLEDYGKLAENLVFNSLDRYEQEIFYWKNSKQEEVDFVIKEKQKIKEIIQVCWNIDKKETREREIKSLISACEEFKLKKGLILTEDVEKEQKVGEVNITYKPIWKWLLE